MLKQKVIFKNIKINMNKNLLFSYLTYIFNIILGLLFILLILYRRLIKIHLPKELYINNYCIINYNLILFTSVS